MLIFRKLLLISFLFCLARPAAASCGLQACPHPAGSGAMGQDLSLTVQHVAYDLEGFKGHYESASPRWQYRSGRDWVAGGLVSVIVNSPDVGHSKTGLGNPVLFGELGLPGGATRFAIGSQLEVPLGDDDHGLAADHFEWLPYVDLRRPRRAATVYGQAGFRLALTNEDEDAHAAGGHAHGPLVVNPHEDSEFVYRLGVAGERERAPRGWELFVDGQHGFDSGTGFLAAGGGLRWTPHRRWDLHLTAELPVTEPHRFERRFGLVVMFQP
jgi:hypothetical protein